MFFNFKLCSSSFVHLLGQIVCYLVFSLGSYQCSETSSRQECIVKFEHIAHVILRRSSYLLTFMKHVVFLVCLPCGDVLKCYWIVQIIKIECVTKLRVVDLSFTNDVMQK